jgi:hypothetical protein
MSRLEAPKNDYARTMFILIDSYIAGVSMAKVLNNYAPNFYKFQTRLGDIERAHPKLKISRTSHPFTNARLNKKGHFTVYTPLSPMPYMKNLYNLLNREGLKSKSKKD